MEKNYRKKSVMNKSQNKSWVLKPEEIVIGLNQRRSFDYIVLMF